MQIKLTDEEKQAIVSQYNDGISVAELCIQRGIPRITLYFWIKRFSPLKTITEKAINYQDYFYLKRHTDKLENNWR